MFRIPRRRPSAALIVACCSLFVALGGTSYAVATGTIGSQEIRDGSIKGVDVANRALRGEKIVLDGIGGNAVKEEALDASKLGTVRHADSADNADTAATATRATSAATADLAARATVTETAATAGGVQLQVMVSADGARFHARGVRDVDKVGNGRYVVTFDRDVSHCVATATLIYEFDFYGAPDGSGTGEIAVLPDAVDSSGTRIGVFTGTSSGTWTDRGFDLLVSC